MSKDAKYKRIAKKLSTALVPLAKDLLKAFIIAIVIKLIFIHFGL